MHQIARPGRFAVLDRGAREAALTEHSKAFRAKLVPFEGALCDERLYEAVR